MIEHEKGNSLKSIALSVFTEPNVIETLSLEQWQDLLRIWRGNDILGNIYYLLERNHLLSQVPDFALRHLRSAKVYSDRQAHQVGQEAMELDHILSDVGIKPTFLKGATYVLCRNTNHYGRVMSDMDILVRKSELSLVEDKLRDNGWIEKTLDSYDEQYFRKWVHELPPYTHAERGTTLDVHHTLIPPVTGYTIPEEILFSNYVETEDGYRVLNPALVIMHCIIHLFFNEDYVRSCRDLIDLHYLIEQFEQSSELNELHSLAKELGFTKELFYTLWLRDKVFNTSSLSEVVFSDEPSLFSKWLVRKVMLPAMMPSHDIINGNWGELARFFMFLRGHYLKMPLRILIPHFCVKSYRALVMMVMGAYHYEK